MVTLEAEHSPALLLLQGAVVNIFRHYQKTSASRLQDLRLLNLPYKQKFQEAAAKLPVGRMRPLPARAHIHAWPDLPRSSHIEQVWNSGHKLAKPGTKSTQGYEVAMDAAAEILGDCARPVLAHALLHARPNRRKAPHIRLPLSEASRRGRTRWKGNPTLRV